jgi:hypothetical protein
MMIYTSVPVGVDTAWRACLKFEFLVPQDLLGRRAIQCNTGGGFSEGPFGMRLGRASARHLFQQIN